MQGDTVTIDKTQLRNALLDWEKAHREGKCMPAADAANLTAEEVSERSAEALWKTLTGQ